MIRSQLSVSREALAQFCRKFGIRRLSLYGSVLRDDFRPDSDIDVLVEYRPGQIHGLAVVDMEQELSQILGGGHKVDIVNRRYLNPRLRQEILDTAEVQYAEG